MRNLIYPSWPTFQCPNCRAYADLEAEVDQPEQELTDGEVEDLNEEAEATTEHDSSKSAQAQTPVHDKVVGRKEDLDNQMQNTSLTGDSSSSRQTSSNTQTDDTRPSSATTSPLNIRDRGPSAGSDVVEGGDPRSATPTTTEQFALAAGLQSSEGPLTPRNDEGPFLLDDRAARRGHETTDMTHEEIQEEDEA